MLFNSFEFIFVFLPCVLLIHYYLADRLGNRVTLWWLVAASLVFYAWWNPRDLALILASITCNYFIGLRLQAGSGKIPRKAWLVFGVALNLGLLGYFKYAGFMVDNLNRLAGSGFAMEDIVLPLAISFYTFQQLDYLVDCYYARAREHHLIHYILFVTFFPHLIAGPIVHHRDLVPQFKALGSRGTRVRDLAVGLTIFFIGLFKKVVLADGMAVYASPAFGAADGGTALTLIAAWTGATAYALQLYFDFSGYSDMAIGLARMFGITMPVNFNSPYRASSIIDFWRRWHITLSIFLREYLYFPLGGSRCGRLRRYGNLMLTMLIGGLWHGAGWNFVMWGGLHGIYLAINHLWRAANRRLVPGLGWALTFGAVLFAWVPFRAQTWEGAFRMWSGMIGMNGIALPTELAGKFGGLEAVMTAAGVSFTGLFTQLSYPVTDVTVLGDIAVTLAIALLAFNTVQYMSDYRPVLPSSMVDEPGSPSAKLRWRPSSLHALWIAVLAFLTAKQALVGEASEFIYFNF